MCIVFIHTNPEPKQGEWRLIIAHNRDEFYKRPAKEAFICQQTDIIGGRDLEADRENGMWLGLKLKQGGKLCFGALLNVTGEDENEDDVKSRGFIVPNYLVSRNSPIDYFQEITSKDNFRAFNLVTTELSKNGVRTNFLSKFPDQICSFAGKQTLGFGNSPVNRPMTKVREGRYEFEKTIRNCGTKKELQTELINFLKSSEKHLPDPELEWRVPQYVKERSSIYVEVEKTYGTRTHTVILVDREWNVEFYEETMESPDNPWLKNNFSFKM